MGIEAMRIVKLTESHVLKPFDCGDQVAENRERMQGMFASQIGKSAGHYRFNLESLLCGEKLPFVSASALNGIRRTLAEELDSQTCIKKDILHREPGRKGENVGLSMKNVSYKANVANALSEQVYKEAGAVVSEQAFELTHRPGAELMRTRYCIKHELGLCPKQPATGKKPIHGKLFLLNNGQKFARTSIALPAK